MKLDVVPFSNIGVAYISKPPSEVRNAFGNDYSTLKPQPLARTTDYFLNASIQVEYDEGDESAFIGASEPNALTYQEINLLNVPFKEIKKWFGTVDKNIYLEPNSVLFLDTGLCFYFEEMEDKNKPQQVAIFKNGYYDFILDMYEKVVF
jgi:hypothetical protein